MPGPGGAAPAEPRRAAAGGGRAQWAMLVRCGRYNNVVLRAAPHRTAPASDCARVLKIPGCNTFYREGMQIKQGAVEPQVARLQRFRPSARELGLHCDHNVITAPLY